jgi:hypothetical protein
MDIGSDWSGKQSIHGQSVFSRWQESAVTLMGINRKQAKVLISI